MVVRRNAPPSVTPQQVDRLEGKKAVLWGEGETQEAARSELVVVAEFGEPIYPGLRQLGSIDRGGDKPAHVVVKSENYHALEALRFTHAGKIDCIYIDPPYNTGARDWKYDNAYVDADDAYRHSKWLAFMERRLRLAKDLLNPDDSALIVTIDEKECPRLALLLQQTFPDARIQMVSSVINPKGTSRFAEFSRTDEYVFFVMIGAAAPLPEPEPDGKAGKLVEWGTLRRRDLASRRGTAKGGKQQFYPIFVNVETQEIEGIGDPLEPEEARNDVEPAPGCVAVFPVRPDGTEMNWGVIGPTFLKRLEGGYIRVGKHDPDAPQPFVISYLKSGPIKAIEEGRAEIESRGVNGSVVARYVEPRRKLPTTNWQRRSHDAERYGTRLLRKFIPGRSFPFPKSLYAVEDALRFFVGEKKNAVILDYFAGSGTTAHAVARLNRQDAGMRQSISVTNNEVSAKEAEELRKNGLAPGDDEWEQLGIFEHITRPRIAAAILGETPDGKKVGGSYKFTDESPMSEGFEENVTFLELKYLSIEDVELDQAFASVAPLLWLRAGGVGPIIDERCDDAGEPKPFDVTAQYGVLFDPDHWRAFVEQLPETVTTAFVVTDSPSVFAAIAGELPSRVDVARLYENYLATFTINRGR